MKRLPARRVLYEKPLTGGAIHRIMRSLFPHKNDYGKASFDELVPELAKLGITSAGEFKRLLTRHRRALLRLDRSKLSARECRSAIAEYGNEFVADAVRRQYWFAYPALVRTAAEMQFGEQSTVYE